MGTSLSAKKNYQICTYHAGAIGQVGLSVVWTPGSLPSTATDSGVASYFRAGVLSLTVVIDS